MSRTVQQRGARKSAVADLAAIVSHPTRRRCWSALFGRVMSPKQLADELGLPTQHVSYHVTALERLGVVELVSTRQVRGATEHFYRIIERYELREEEVKALGAKRSMETLTLVYQLQLADIAASLDSGKMLERTDHAAIRQPLVLDEEGWRAIGELMVETLERIDQLQQEAAARTSDDPGVRSIHAMAHLNFFEMPDRDDRVNQF